MVNLVVQYITELCGVIVIAAVSYEGYALLHAKNTIATAALTTTTTDFNAKDWSTYVTRPEKTGLIYM